MGSVNANIIPASTGLSLGSQNQRWNGWLSVLNSGTPVNASVTNLAFSVSPVFSVSTFFSVFTITLTGNVASSAVTGTTQGFIVVQIRQDGVGGRTFAWPASFQQPVVVGSSASQVTTQLFYFDGVSAWPLGPGVLTP